MAETWLALKYNTLHENALAIPIVTQAIKTEQYCIT